MCASGSSEPRSTPSRVSRPWTTSTEPADSSTPMPNDDANAIAANPSSTDLSVSWSMPRPSPSDSEPRMVRGPTQNSSDALSHPSMNRSRAAVVLPGLLGADERRPPGEPVLDHPGEALEALLDPQHRPADAADQQAAEDDQHGRPVAHGRGERPVGHAHRRQARHEQRGEAQAVGDHRARALREAVTDRHTEQ